MYRHYISRRVYGEVKCNLPGELNKLSSQGYIIQSIVSQGGGFWNPLWHTIIAYKEEHTNDPI